jgi:cytochrome b561
LHADPPARGDNLFGLVQVPAFDPGNRALRRAAAGWHELAANWLLILAGLHALVALAHHYIRRDGVLRRMLPGLK